MANWLRILVVTNQASDADRVRKELGDEYTETYYSNGSKQGVEDFQLLQPRVLILALGSLPQSEAFCRELYHSNALAHAGLYRMILLCNETELEQAYELCKQDIYDDYLQFWPHTADPLRLRMLVHQAQQQLFDSDTISQAPSLNKLNPHNRQVRPSILLVDDDEYQHKLVGGLLAELDTKLVCVMTAGEAMRKLRKLKPNLILMDFNLPEVDGIEATRQLKAADGYTHIPIIMITGHSMKDVVVDSLDAGACDFVVKPFDGETLLRKVSHYLQHAD